MRHVMLLLSFAVLLIGGRPGRAQEAGASLPPGVLTTPGPHVVVNGQLLDARPRLVRGSLLLPLRAAFEALEAEVRWEPSARQITATRGTTTVTLWINHSTAQRGAETLTLVVAPCLIDGTTYVPLRFVAEAFGAEVAWLSAWRTARIVLAPAAGAPVDPLDPPPPIIPQPPIDPVVPPPLPAAVPPQAGVLASMRLGPAAWLYLNTAERLQLPVAIPAGATVLRGVIGTLPRPDTLDALQVGDFITVSFTPAGEAAVVTATYSRTQGKVAGITGTTLILLDGRLFTLTEALQLTDSAGRRMALASVPAGSEVVLECPADTTVAWRMIVTPPAPPPPPDPPMPPPHIVPPPPPPVIGPPAVPPPPPPAVRPVITSVSAAEGAWFRAGDRIRVRVEGTCHADRVVARLGSILGPITLRELYAGVYVGEFEVRNFIRAIDEPLLAVMYLGYEHDESRGPRISIDSDPPVIRRRSPASRSTVTERSPEIEVEYEDAGGSGISVKSIYLEVNGRDVTKDARPSSQRMRYALTRANPGRVDVRLVLRDIAGNRTDSAWSFTLAAPPPDPFDGARLTHTANGTLAPGDRLTLTAHLPARPERLEWYLGDKRISSEVRLVAADTYRLDYTIAREDRPGRYNVSVRVTMPKGTTRTISADRTVTIAAPPPPPPPDPDPFENARLTHSANDAVKPGERLQCTAHLKARPASLEWYLGEKRISTDITQIAADTYRAEYIITQDDRPGRYTASVRVTMPKGTTRTLTADRPVTIAAPPPPPEPDPFAGARLSLEAADTVKPGERVTLTAYLKVRPTSLEWYLGEKRISTEVAQVSADTYRAAYTIAQDDRPGRYTASVRVTMPKGTARTLTGDRTVTIAAPPPPPEPAATLSITSPAEGSKLPDTLTVTGTATAEGRVRVTVTFAGHPLTHKPGTGELYAGTLTVGKDGSWQTPGIDTTKPKGIVRCGIKVELLDKDGHAVKSVSMTLRR